MGKLTISSICCTNCNKLFNVNTEDIEWEHMKNMGVNDSNPNKFDYELVQNIVCPYCNSSQKIIFRAIGSSEYELEEMTISSL